MREREKNVTAEQLFLNNRRKDIAITFSYTIDLDCVTLDTK
jgi:hypothetical protein